MLLAEDDIIDEIETVDIKEELQLCHLCIHNIRDHSHRREKLIGVMNHQARKIPDCLTQAIMTSPRALLLLQLHHRTRCLVKSISFFASGIPITSTICCFHDCFFLLWIESHVALKFWLFCD
jgi:hypothetical protein